MRGIGWAVGDGWGEGWAFGAGSRGGDGGFVLGVVDEVLVRCLV